jgi:citronellol/citronellal dehydrogenase
MHFAGKTIFITGASRGIGRSIALKLAKEGANVVIAAKSVSDEGKLPGTIYSVAKEVEAMGGNALPIQCDIRFEEQIIQAVDNTLIQFGGIDAVINNASAIGLTNTLLTESKRFDLMHDINVRGTFFVTKHCIPHLKQSPNAHILTLSPPLNMAPVWFAHHLAYTLSKYNMTMMAKGWAEELKNFHIASNSLWPATTIATAAVQHLLGGDLMIQRSRKPDIVADAAYYILSQDATICTGNSFIDEEVLKANGINDFTSYAISPDKPLQKDIFLD